MAGWRRVLLGAGIAIGLASSCTRQADSLEDHLEICSLRCEQTLECAPESFDYTDVAQCAAQCNVPDAGQWATDACDDLVEANMLCISELSCEEYEVHEMNVEGSPCYETTYDASVCLAQHS